MVVFIYWILNRWERRTGRDTLAAAVVGRDSSWGPKLTWIEYSLPSLLTYVIHCRVALRLQVAERFGKSGRQLNWGISRLWVGDWVFVALVRRRRG